MAEPIPGDLPPGPPEPAQVFERILEDKRTSRIGMFFVLGFSLLLGASVVFWAYTGPVTGPAAPSTVVPPSPASPSIPTEAALDEVANTLATLASNGRQEEFASVFDGLRNTYPTCSVGYSGGAFSDGQLLIDKLAADRTARIEKAPLGPPVFGVGIVDVPKDYPVAGARFFVIQLAVSCPSRDGPTTIAP